MNLHFLDEAAGSDESWTLKLGTESTMKALVSAISIPWEQLFSVPLQIVNKTVLVVPNWVLKIINLVPYAGVCKHECFLCIPQNL